MPFYDLNRTDISCPNCGTVLDTSVVKYARTPPSSTPAWKRGGRRSQRTAPAPVAEPADCRTSTSKPMRTKPSTPMRAS